MYKEIICGEVFMKKPKNSDEVSNNLVHRDFAVSIPSNIKSVIVKNKKHKDLKVKSPKINPYPISTREDIVFYMGFEKK